MPIYPPKDIENHGKSKASDSFAGALIVDVDPETPADDAGFTAGCRILSVDGKPVRDLIDWRWLSSDYAMLVGYIDLDGDTGEVELERAEGESWGFTFDGVVFDGVHQCRNACTFCFMRQLPPHMRGSLYVRDDDFRLSFLAGTFVTLTNVFAADEARIIEQHISPLRVSLHASNEQVRQRLIGKHAQAGLQTFDRLLAAGIQAHTQIVLVPGENDGEVLRETLEWAQARPGILSVGIVPLGYTRHQNMFTHSFNDARAAQEVLDIIAPFQQQARDVDGTPWVYAADEFYRNAYGDDVLNNLPPSSDYGDFSMFEDGIGILRSCVDDWRQALQNGVAQTCAQVLRAAHIEAYYVAGFALQETFPALIQASPLQGLLQPLLIKNDFFGGNVDVTGLLTGADVVRALQSLANQGAPDASADQRHRLYVLPRVMFNDDGVTLDGFTVDDMSEAAGCSLSVVSCIPSEYLEEITCLASEMH